VVSYIAVTLLLRYCIYCTASKLIILSLLNCLVSLLISPMAQKPLVGQGVLVFEASRSHSDTPQSVGLLWTSDQPDADTSTWQHTTITWHKHPCLQQDSYPHSQQTSHRRPKPETVRPLGSTVHRSVSMKYSSMSLYQRIQNTDYSVSLCFFVGYCVCSS